MYKFSSAEMDLYLIEMTVKALRRIIGTIEYSAFSDKLIELEEIPNFSLKKYRTYVKQIGELAASMQKYKENVK